MSRQKILALLITGLSIGMSLGTAVAGDVNINIGAPAVVLPPPVISVQPQVVAVPGSAVYTAPQVDFNVFLFGGKYWSHHNDVWFVAPRPGARWTRVAVAAVPHEVRAVPVTYYKVKPKHAKGMKGMKGEREHEGKGCPPGLAKQGRC
jgi:hypothetical protein